MVKRILIIILLLPALGWGGSTLTIWGFARQAGYTTDEVVRELQRRLMSRPKLLWWGGPLLASSRATLGIPEGEPLALRLVPTPASGEVMASAAMPEAPPWADWVKPGMSPPTSVLRVGPSQRYSKIGDAVRAARSGSLIEVEPGDYWADTVLLNKQEMTIRAIAPGVRVLAGGASVQGKGIWVVQSGNVVIEGIHFQDSRVADRNGAGIRLEGGSLTVRRCTFHHNENGVITSNAPDVELTVENSEFSHNGHGDGQSHSLYAGRIARLTVVGSYFHHGYVGHHIKSRARRSEVLFNRITDESGGRASYEVEFPNGGEALLVGNVIQQAASSSNSTLVSFGAEGYAYERNQLVMLHNTLVNDHPRGGSMLRVAPGERSAFVANNLWVGLGRIQELGGAVDAIGNLKADWSDLIRPLDHDYRLRDSASFPATRLEENILGTIPWGAYVHRFGVRRIAAPPAHVGAPAYQP